jgi:hypothetical protein
MSTQPVKVEASARHTVRSQAVPMTMDTVRAALPLLRALVLATLVTLLIMIGLPTLLAAAAAATP